MFEVTYSNPSQCLDLHSWKGAHLISAGRCRFSPTALGSTGSRFHTYHIWLEAGRRGNWVGDTLLPLLWGNIECWLKTGIFLGRARNLLLQAAVPMHWCRFNIKSVLIILKICIMFTNEFVRYCLPFLFKIFKKCVCVSICYNYVGTQRGQKTRIPWSWS